MLTISLASRMSTCRTITEQVHRAKRSKRSLLCSLAMDCPRPLGRKRLAPALCRQLHAMGADALDAATSRSGQKRDHASPAMRCDHPPRRATHGMRHTRDTIPHQQEASLLHASKPPARAAQHTGLSSVSPAVLSCSSERASAMRLCSSYSALSFGRCASLYLKIASCDGKEASRPKEARADAFVHPTGCEARHA